VQSVSYLSILIWSLGSIPPTESSPRFEKGKKRGAISVAYNWFAVQEQDNEMFELFQTSHCKFFVSLLKLLVSFRSTVMTYLERYNNGVYEQVWHELQRMGKAVREEPIYADAVAVARETMIRVRQNILLLIERLSRMGFVFGYDHRLRSQSISFFQKPLARKRYLDMFFWAREQPPVFEDAHVTRGQRLVIEDIDTFLPDTQKNLQLLEQEIGPVAISVSAWYTEVGAVNFYGSFDRWNTFAPSYFMARCDPVQVRALDEKVVAFIKEQRRRDKQGTIAWNFAPGSERKDYYAGDMFSPYRFDIPNQYADVLLYTDGEEDVTFVSYLRTSLLRYAGFPGIARWPVKPEEDLARLTEGLLPF
jgi:hypothetical protein